MSKTKKNPLGMVIFILAIAGIGAFFFLAPSQAERAAGNETGGVEEQVQPAALPVKAITAGTGTLQDYIRLSGDVQAASTINVLPDAAGKLASLSVSTGDYVRRGTTLASVDPSRPGAAFSLSPVGAPISGTVIGILAEVGETVSPNTPVVTLGRLDELEIEAFLSEKYINRVKIGQPALIRLEALPGEVREARVAELAPIVNPQTRTLKVTLALEKAAQTGGIKAGMLAEIELIIDERTNIVRLPDSALHTRGGKSFVYRLTDINPGETGTVERLPVETGLRVDGHTEIISGVNPGDLLITSGTSRLADGMEVTLIAKGGWE